MLLSWERVPDAVAMAVLGGRVDREGADQPGDDATRPHRDQISVEITRARTGRGT